LEEDPEVKRYMRIFETFKEKLAVVDRKIKAISKMEFLGFFEQ
jgi:hypothetical protein